MMVQVNKSQIPGNVDFHHWQDNVTTSETTKCPYNLGSWIVKVIKTSWWFQPIWKILVKLDRFPR